MFTGIIQDVGTVVKSENKGGALRLVVRTALGASGVNLGDSIAVNGVCLTVTAKKPDGKSLALAFDAIPETVKRSTLAALETGDKVNIESAIRAGEPFGGHFVQGHVDTVGVIDNIKKQGKEYIIRIDCRAEVSDKVIEKGSVALDGISLTVVDVQKKHLSVALIPFTLAHSIMGQKKAGDKVNVEFDLIGKWISRLAPQKSKSRGHYSDEGF